MSWARTGRSDSTSTTRKRASHRRRSEVGFIHGGGFYEGDKIAIIGPTNEGGSANLSELMARGYVVASLNYRLSGEAPFPAAVEDCKAAIRFLRANAARLGFNGDRIGVWGTSAGGSLASMLGVTAASDGLESSGGNANVSSRIQAVVDLFGATDFVNLPSRLMRCRPISRERAPLSKR